MLKREILLTGCAIVLALTMSGNVSAEETCAAVPTCSSLGYNKTSCNGLVSLKCPFDKTKLFCGVTCTDSGMIYDGVDGCKRRLFYSDGKVIAIALGDLWSYNVAIALTDEGYMTWDEAFAACAAKTTGGKTWELMHDPRAGWGNVLSGLSSYFTENGGINPYDTGDTYWTMYASEGSTAAAFSVRTGSGGSVDKSDNRPAARCVFYY